MCYEVINEELRIKACSIGDLTTEQAVRFLKGWGDGAKLGELTLFYEAGSGDLVLNKDCEDYNIYLDMAEAFMGGDYETRIEIKKACPPKMIEAIWVMEKCIKARRIDTELFRAGSHFIESKPSWTVLNEIPNRYNLQSSISIAFHYGVMQGKRMERYKKRQSQTI